MTFRYVTGMLTLVHEFWVKTKKNSILCLDILFFTNKNILGVLKILIFLTCEFLTLIELQIRTSG